MMDEFLGMNSGVGKKYSISRVFPIALAASLVTISVLPAVKFGSSSPNASMLLAS
jgi:hypothetical protein